MPNEVSVHAQEYGLAGLLFDDESFDTDDDEEEDEKPSVKQEWGDRTGVGSKPNLLMPFKKVKDDPRGCLNQISGLMWKRDETCGLEFQLI